MPTTPPTISAAPPVPQRQVKATFSDRVDAFVTWLAAAVTQFAAVATNVYSNAVEAFNSATTANTAAATATDARDAAVATANATPWVSGATVQQYAKVISPLDHRPYVRKTAAGSGTTDPKLDTTNYEPMLPLAKAFVSADQTITAGGTLTIAHGMGILPKSVDAFARLTTSENSLPVGRVFALSTQVRFSGGISYGCTVTMDATNIYVSFANGTIPGGGNSTFGDFANPNAVFYVRAFA